MVAASDATLPALSDLYVYLTDRCNCACVHCWIVSSAPHAGPGHFLAPEMLEAAIKEALPLGLTSLKWTGGEPTIHPDLPAMLAIQKRYGLRGRLETNGLRLTPALAQMLRESGVDHISVSLDGAHPATHDAIRGQRGAYARTLAGVRCLVEAGYRPQIIMSLMQANVTELEALLALAEEIGAGSVKFNIVQPTLRGRELHQRGAALSVPDLIALNRRVEQGLASRYAFPIYFDIPMAFRALTHILARGVYRCGIMNILGLLADGCYALCGIGVNVPEMVFGRAGAGALDDIWRSHPALTTIRAGLPARLQGICGDCLMKGVCLGSCVAQNYYLDQDILGENWFCKEAKLQGVFPLGRLHTRYEN